MSQFAILRIQKLKAGVALQRSLKHAFRAQDTPNADPTRLAENTHIGATSVDEALAGFRERLPEKIRKNGVLAVEFLVTASPEVMAKKSRADQDRYFEDALTWLKARHGAENVFYAGIHRDELTPHMYAYVVPLDDQGKLNCRSFYGGAAALSRMQTDFAERVGKRHGLERGIEGSKARHTTVREFYAGIQAAEKPMRSINAKALEPRVIEEGGLLRRAMVESHEQVTERVNRAIHAEFKPLATAAAGVAGERKKRQQAEATAKAKTAELDAVRPLVEAIHGLPPADVAALVEQARGMQRVAQIAAETARRATALVKAAKDASGSAVARWARWAINAIDQVGGDHRKVGWEAVESGWGQAAQAGRDGGSELSRETIMRTLLDHSPGRAGLDAETRKQVLAEVRSQQPGTPQKLRPDRGRGHSL